MSKPTDQQLYETLTEVIAELEAFWDVPGTCPTIKKLKAVAGAFRPVDDVQPILDMIREHRHKRVINASMENV